ncbi:hypothetical protein [Candidatus Synchoanobacter obligatus]|uniref:MATE family efflux transporter n=1 Tax=Candidatus Synchoanobacter obligatus TaxID=2919597 RepID=A0ABT1L433_9GAMM|nr:hypothetical protein [Candidatus Synchoanobacter obligatus]MCP8351874.1 hypothetical protein [Candidatus Synchoanobacter obligatus]
MGIVLPLVLAEGFVVLASEVTLMRLLMPYVGSGIDVTAILITAILLPMAYGYAYAGTLGHASNEQVVARRLCYNFFMAQAILLVGLSYLKVDLFFHLCGVIGLVNHWILTAIYAVLFVVYPVFLLAQTLPLVTAYFKEVGARQLTGQLLFFST